jgi:TP901 family phage tail tape measure protein
MAENDWIISLIAGLDSGKSREQIKKDLEKIVKELNLALKVGKIELNKEQQNTIKSQLDKLEVSLKDVSVDTEALNKLVEQVNGALSGIKIAGFDVGKSDIKEQTQKIGQQIETRITNDVSQGFTKGLKSFSELKVGEGTEFGIIFNKKGLIDAENTLKEIKKTYSDFGQVKITNEIFDSGELKEFKVNIQQINGDLKETRSFMMSKSNDGQSFIPIDNIVNGSESIVHHLDEAKNATNKIVTEEEKLAEQISKVREKTELSRQSEEKRQELAQNNAINKALEKEYAERERIAEQAGKIIEGAGDKGDITTGITLLRDGFIKLGLSADEVKNKMSGVDKEYGLLKQVIADGDNNAIVTQFNKVNASLSQTKNDLKITTSELSKVNSELNSINRSEKLNIKISGLESNIANLQRISPEIANFKAQINGATVSIESLYEDLSKVNTQSDFSVVSAKFTAFKNAAKSAGIATSEFSSIIKGQLKQVGDAFKQTFSIAAVGMAAISKTKEAVSELKEIDTYLTEISKANDKLTAAELKEIGNNSFDVASKYGKTAPHYLAGIQEASRAGYVNAEGIAELSVAAQGAGDMTAELANQYIIATDKAYKLGGSVEKLTEILDGSNYITNHNAVNMTELAEGMSIVGSQAASFGVGVNETTAALGTMIATTQQSGSEMARAFKGILLNIRQVTDEEEGIDAEGLNKYEEACKALNVSLKETKNGITSLRNPMEVLKELSVEYSKLDSNDVRRTDLLNSVGGKLRSNALNTLLMNYDMYSQMLEQYAQGTGSMAAEAEKTANSWE